MSDATRTRTVTWEDPDAGLLKALSMEGIDAVKAMLSGELPAAPMSRLLGIRGVEAEKGRVVVALEPAEYHGNGTGGVHGGLAASLIDSAAWLALHTEMPAGAFCSTLQLNIHYVRPLRIGGGEVFAEGRVLYCGRTTATAEARITDERGKILAHGTTHCTVLRP
ncbi:MULTISPECIES: PaaI family thioesterase [Thermomonospora]|uniref:Thioesterase superfamily protein n=1 Tax=Thermomonospora curvata (strain ATCC 19995 / DSM 43183 / JCM 3096 / KCTC 9072 / NBRC 15933 / NCIMB 10081 / Henssen B9) TaxID=471852 RepID=D1A4Z7_THECD|nr:MULTISPECIES: PaaI family thioesterase [Thermomonospora]ACY98166.1 thioesterase superfamily protein [Thermomonospora curvata DSM 43183]PKK13939.1 MAG: PaaI family thioesterase [Thermomonospora sp. CIF 1]